MTKIQNTKPFNIISNSNYKSSSKISFSSNNQQDKVEITKEPKKNKNIIAIVFASAFIALGTLIFLKNSNSKNLKNIIEDGSNKVDEKLNKVEDKVKNKLNNIKTHASESDNKVNKSKLDIETNSNNAVKDSPAYSLKTAKECIEKLFGKIPTEKNELKKFVNATYESHGIKMSTLPLEVAAHYGDNNLIKLFLDHGANINHAGVGGETALHSATKMGHLDTVKLLLNNGADMNAICDKSIKSRTIEYSGRDIHAIDLAAENGHNDLIEFFIKKGVKIDRIDNHGNTPLLLAANNGHAKTVELLIKKGLKVNWQNHLLDTPLHKAVKNGHNEVIKILLKNGASVKLKDDCGRTPLFVAAQNGQAKTIDILLKHRADINSFNEVGLTPLQVCSSWDNDKNMVEFLLNKGASLNALSKNKTTALDEAISFKNEGIVDLLRTRGGITAKELLN